MTEKPSVMVRGIYTTALVKLLLDNGFRIARPSLTTATRFGLQEATKSWDAVIRDHSRRGDIVIEGSRAKDVIELLVKEIPHLVLRCEKIGYEIYKGVVEKVEGNVSYIDYRDGVGVLAEKLSEGQEVIISPLKNSIDKTGHVQLTKRVRIVGRYADLIKDGWISTSKDVPQSVASELMKLGSLLKPTDWGIQWKKEAIAASTEELIEEVQRLKEEALKVMRRACEIKAPCLIYDPPTCYVVSISYNGKRRLDELRSLVVSTMPNHHLIKSWGKRYAYTVDVVEKLMNAMGPSIGEAASKIMIRDAIKKGSKVAIEHVKPDGRVYRLTPGIVEDFNDDMILILKRRFKGGGVYDGLGVPKENGDYGVSAYKLGSPVSKTSYYNERGELKGIYVNISTPVEFAPRKIRYIDLEVDIIAKPMGEVTILDINKAKKLLDKGIITEGLFRGIVEVAEKVKESLEAKGDVSFDLRLS
ncbi:MAG: DUF402 domain-containing protein [Candidatus Nezhaarchaeota archaeon]|nr:DUF402 domain-containing protein [Candidatus Nezhaarchaeota archaeon]MCX8142255.1 DUF402 domain-containing protein [Candidatus Nezhaarchaeota archaeon]MDW8050772.1 DUF402 domain-containing protein [Nitrososphaerota archaeon]